MAAAADATDGDGGRRGLVGGGAKARWVKEKRCGGWRIYGEVEKKFGGWRSEGEVLRWRRGVVVGGGWRRSGVVGGGAKVRWLVVRMKEIIGRYLDWYCCIGGVDMSTVTILW